MSDPDEATLGEILTYGIDEPTRTIYLFETLDAVTLQRVLPALRFFAEADDEEPIRIVATSPGGSERVMWALVDTIEMLPCPVIVEAYGSISSAATSLLAVASEALVGANTEVLLHAMTTEIGEGDYAYTDLAPMLAALNNSSHRLAAMLARPGRLEQEELLEILLGDEPEQRLVGVAIVSAGLAKEVIRPARALTAPAPDASATGPRQMPLPMGDQPGRPLPTT